MPVALAVALLLAPADVAARVERAPPAVRDFIHRRAGCNHWAGEEAYDAARGREIAAALRRGRCDALQADERVLRRRHARSPALLKLLDETEFADGAP